MCRMWLWESNMLPAFVAVTAGCLAKRNRLRPARIPNAVRHTGTSPVGRVVPALAYLRCREESLTRMGTIAPTGSGVTEQLRLDQRRRDLSQAASEQGHGGMDTADAGRGDLTYDIEAEPLWIRQYHLQLPAQRALKAAIKRGELI